MHKEVCADTPGGDDPAAAAVQTAGVVELIIWSEAVNTRNAKVICLLEKLLFWIDPTSAIETIVESKPDTQFFFEIIYKFVLF